MYFLSNKTAQIDDLLARAAEKLQLDKTRREKIENSYKAIQEVLENDQTYFNTKNFEIYPHGSVRIGTTVKPLGKNEFDLDIVLHIRDSVYGQTDPMKVFNELKRVLSANGNYKDKVKPKNRCVRLDYTGDYHMDILSGCQENVNNQDKIVIPDRELKEYLISNPRGYARWFIGKAESVRQTLLEKAYAAEEIPADDFASKKPLQRAVQILKRYRDLFFEKEPDYATPSIVLTTLAGELYQNEESIFDTIDNIISQINSKVSLSRLKRFKVLNPVDIEEDFTDRWEREPKYYSEFIRFSESLYKSWQKLKEDNGIVEESKIMKGIIGEKLYSDSIKEQTLLTEDFRRKGKVFSSTATGALGSKKVSDKPVMKNTFFWQVRKYWKNNLSIPVQYANVKGEYPQFKTSILKDSLLIKGDLQPTPRSIIYHFKLKYYVGKRPIIKITKPELKRNFNNENIPHVYSCNELCLYYPSYKEFDSKCKLSAYIIPWISLWLYYYEIWHITGEWLGGGKHPRVKE